MRYQVGPRGWPVTGQHLIPPSTILDYADKRDDELTPYETIAKGKVPPLDITIMDADCAMVMWRSVHSDLHHRLQRKLDPFQEETFRRLSWMPEEAQERLWPRGKG